jgi:hypothetical protein
MGAVEYGHCPVNANSGTDTANVSHEEDRRPEQAHSHSNHANVSKTSAKLFWSSMQLVEDAASNSLMVSGQGNASTTSIPHLVCRSIEPTSRTVGRLVQCASSGANPVTMRLAIGTFCIGFRSGMDLEL